VKTSNAINRWSSLPAADQCSTGERVKNKKPSCR